MISKLLNTMVRINNKIPGKLVDYLYLAAFALVLIYDYDFLTRFDRGPFRLVYIAGAALAAIVLLIRFLNIKNENMISLAFAAVLLLIGISYILARGSYYFFVLTLLIVGAMRVEEKKILTVYLLVATLFFGAMLTHFFVTYPDWKELRSIHFGSINTTDCQGMILFLLVTFLFYREEHIGFTEIIVCGGIVLWFWSYTHAEINMYCSLVCLVLAGVMKAGSALELKIGIKPRQALGYLVSFSFLICAVVMIFLTARFDADNEKWRALNEILHQRLESSHRIYTLYPPCAWGSEYVQNGWGYQPGASYWDLYPEYGYSFIDSSYPHILINHGYLVFAMIVGVMTFVSFRYAKKGDLYKVLLLAVIAVDCAAEGHLKELSCNVWLILPFARYAATPCELFPGTRAFLR